MPSFDQATTYENNSSVMRDEGLAMINHLSPEKGSKVLDLGCGTGYLSKVLADRVGVDGKVVAIDPDVHRLRVAREKYSATNVEYLEGCAENLPGEGYDLIYSTAVLHWVKNLQCVFQQADRILNKGGKFAFNNLLSMEDQFKDPEMYSEKFIKFFSECIFFRDEADIQQLSSKYNFEVTFMEKRANKWILPDVFNLIESLIAITHGKLDASDFNVEAMRSYYGDSKIVIEDPLLAVVLQKK